MNICIHIYVVTWQGCRCSGIRSCLFGPCGPASLRVQNAQRRSSIHVVQVGELAVELDKVEVPKRQVAVHIGHLELVLEVLQQA